MAEKWEFVVKGGKHKSKTQMTTKELKQIKEDNLNGNRFQKVLEEETDESVSPELSKISSKITKNKTKTTKGDNSNNLNQQIIKLSGDNIKDVHKELVEKFPNQYTVVLMDLAVHINLLLKINEDSTKNIPFDQFDILLVQMPSQARSALRSVFNGLNNVQIGNFLKSAMIQIVDDNERNLKSVGLILLVQVCLKDKPLSLITNRKQIFDLLNLYREQTVKFKCLVWVLRQACLNFNVACQIWLIYLLPFISQKCHTETVLLFGEEMMSYTMEASGNDSALLPTDFIPIVDLIFNQTKDVDGGAKKTKRKTVNFQLTEAHLQRLNHIYRMIKDQIFTPKTPGSLKDFFASLFLRLSLNNDYLNKELLDCLDHCLLMSPESFKQLDHLYQRYPQQTRILLDHLQGGRSAAAVAMTKQKTYRAVIEKIHSSTVAAAAGSSQDSLHKLTTRATKSSSGSLCGTVLRTLMYTVLMAVLALLVVRHMYPRHYSHVQRVVGPLYEAVLDKTGPYVRLCQQRSMAAYKSAEPYVVDAAQRLRDKTVSLWRLSEPYVQAGSARLQLAVLYVHAKVEEVAPRVLETLGDTYVSVQTYTARCYRDLARFTQSAEMQQLMRSVSEKAASVGEQTLTAYRSAVDYVYKLAGQ